MKKYWPILFSLFILSSCGEEQVETSPPESEQNNQLEAEKKNKFTKISGTIANSANSTLYLFSYGNSIGIEDSVTIDENGLFSIEKNLGTNFYGLGTKNNQLGLFLSSGDDIQLNFDITNILETAKIKGSEGSQAYLEYMKSKKIFFDGRQTYEEQLKSLPREQLTQEHPLYIEAQGYVDAYMEKVRKFVQDNDHSGVVYVAIDDLNNPEKDMEALASIKMAVSTYLPGTIFEANAQKKLSEMERSINAIAEQKKQLAEQNAMAEAAGIAPGRMAPDIGAKKPDGSFLKLSDLRGKVVLLDFWASWCRPCRIANPGVVKLYNQYKNRGFTVLSYSLDNNADRWTQAIQQDGLTWDNHISDLGGWQSPGAALYSVRSIPKTFLIGKDGKIIASGLHNHELELKLKELLD